jgi:predicted nucleotidyltransferase
MLPKLTKDFRDFIELLQKYKVEFAVCGGHAVAFYGYPRMTMDFDLLIRPNAENADKLIACLAESGFGNIPQLKKELFLQPGTVFSLGAQPNQIDLLTSMSSQNVDDIFKNKVEAQLEGFTLYYVSYEDLITAKKEANRLKDQLDIEELLSINGSYTAPKL